MVVPEIGIKGVHILPNQVIPASFVFVSKSTVISDQLIIVLLKQIAFL